MDHPRFTGCLCSCNFWRHNDFSFKEKKHCEFFERKSNEKFKNIYHLKFHEHPILFIQWIKSCFNLYTFITNWTPKSCNSSKFTKVVRWSITISLVPRSWGKNMKFNNSTMLPKPTKHKEENNIAKPNKGVKHSTTSMNYVIMVYNLDLNIFFQ